SLLAVCAVPPSLTAATSAAAFSASPPAPIARLATEVLRPMIPLRLLALSLVVCAGIAFALGSVPGAGVAPAPVATAATPLPPGPDPRYATPGRAARAKARCHTARPRTQTRLSRVPGRVLPRRPVPRARARDVAGARRRSRRGRPGRQERGEPHRHEHVGSPE